MICYTHLKLYMTKIGDFKIFESALLLCFLLNALRFWNMPILIAVLNGLLFLIFLLLTFNIGLKSSEFVERLRIISGILLILVLLISMFSFYVGFRKEHPQEVTLHDGMKQTEFATEKFLHGENPYSITYERVLVGNIFYPDGKPHPVLSHYVYSPMTFLVNAPFSILEKNILGFVDMRISLVFFWVLAAIIGSFMVYQKLLFWTVFLLNPLFLPLVLFGANDSYALLFLVGALVLASKARFELATVMVALMGATKIIVLPFVPIYFIYLILKYKKQGESGLKVLKNVGIFVLVSLLIYLPFAIWNFSDLTRDIIVYPFFGGEHGHPISGIGGLPQILSSMGFINGSSSFPFYLIQLLFSVFFLRFSFIRLRSSLYLKTLCILFLCYFLLMIFFARVIQINYLAILPQVLFLAGLIHEKKI